MFEDFLHSKPCDRTLVSTFCEINIYNDKNRQTYNAERREPLRDEDCFWDYGKARCGRADRCEYRFSSFYAFWPNVPSFLKRNTVEGPLYTIAKGCYYEIVRTLRTHLKDVPLKIGIGFCVNRYEIGLSTALYFVTILLMWAPSHI